jgi:hypothetical protein
VDLEAEGGRGQTHDLLVADDLAQALRRDGQAGEHGVLPAGLPAPGFLLQAGDGDQVALVLHGRACHGAPLQVQLHDSEGLGLRPG